MIGKKFGRLTVLSECEKRAKNGKIRYKCQCDCGNITEVMGENLRRGITKSCGCLLKEITSKRSITHGKTNTRIYAIWYHMKARCYNSNEHRYKDYGRRGINICDEWKDNFKAFYDWSMLNGYNDTLTIDRIDVDGNYEPNNCRWLTLKQQQENKRNSIKFTYNGETHCLREWCNILNINYKTVHKRIHVHKWDIEKALFTPIRKMDLTYLK